MVLLIVGVRIVSLLVSLVNGIISAKVAAELVYDLKKTIFSAISALSLSFFSNRQTGGLMTQVNNDATTIYWFFCDGFPYFVTNLLQLVVVLVIMLATNWLLTLYTFYHGAAVLPLLQAGIRDVRQAACKGVFEKALVQLAHLRRAQRHARGQELWRARMRSGKRFRGAGSGLPPHRPIRISVCGAIPFSRAMTFLMRTARLSSGASAAGRLCRRRAR